MPNAMLTYGVNTNLNGVNGFSRQLNTITYNTLVADATDTTVVVPNKSAIGQLLPDNGATPQVLAVISYAYGATVFVADQTPTNGVTTAAPDASGVFTLKPGVINPSAILTAGGDTLHFYSIGATAYVSIEFFFVN